MPMDLNAILQGLNNGLSSPLTNLALGILQNSGFSQTPVSTGQAIARGVGAGQQLEAGGMQNQFQRIALGRNLAYLKALQGDTDQTAGNPLMSTATQTLPGNPLSPQTPDTSSQGMQAIFGTPDERAAKGEPPLQAPQSAPAIPGTAFTPSAKPQNDPILSDPVIQKDLALANAAPDAPTQSAWLTRARLDYDMLANTPQYKGAQAGAVAQAEFGPKAMESLLSQAGRTTAVNPGEGQVAVSSLSLMDPTVMGNIARTFGLSLPGAPNGSSAPAALTGTPAPMKTSGNMSGIPTPYISTPGGLNSQGAVYGTKLQGAMAQADVDHVKQLWDDAKTSSEGQQQLEEMWSARNQGMYTGAGAALSGDIAKWAAAAGIPLSDETQKQLVNLQTFNKGAANLGVAVAKSLSSRPSQFEFKYLSGNAIANPQMQDAAIPIVMSQMGSVFQWKQMKARFVDQQMRNGVNPRQAEDTFDTQGSATPYAIAILRQNDPAAANKLLNYLKANNPQMYEKLGRETMWLQNQGLMPSTKDLMGGSY